MRERFSAGQLDHSHSMMMQFGEQLEQAAGRQAILFLIAVEAPVAIAAFEIAGRGQLDLEIRRVANIRVARQRGQERLGLGFHDEQTANSEVDDLDNAFADFHVAGAIGRFGAARQDLTCGSHTVALRQKGYGFAVDRDYGVALVIDYAAERRRSLERDVFAKADVVIRGQSGRA